MFQKLLVLFLSFNLVFADVIPRDSNDDIMDTTRVTKIPFGFYKEKMEKGTYKVVDKEDLSSYPLKRIFAGYGIFDIEEKGCKYIENGENKNNFIKEFENINIFANHTFAISRSQMTYPQCVALTQKYAGIVYAPKSITENSAISKGYFLKDNAWIGMHKSNCNNDYINSSGLNQSYSNFLFKDEPCSQTKLNVIKKANKTSWLRRSLNSTAKCIIRIETNDYKKPIKICAPWWRIESTFINKNKETLIWDGREISFENFLAPDVPQRINVCTEREELKGHDSNSTIKKYCKKYFSRKPSGGKSGQCLEEPIQPACEVNECFGYIENNCKKIEKLDSFKDYTWGYIIKDNQAIRVKMKDKIKTYVYECPSVNPNANNCLKREELIVFPKECPNSKCDELRVCIESNAHTGKYCKETYPCEKIYGDSALTPIYVNGHIEALRAKCRVTSTPPLIIENDNIRKQTYSKTSCLEYEEILEVNTTIEKCLSTKVKTLHQVNTSITEPDIYADNSDCVRTNNIEDARPYVDAVFEYKNRGFFITSIEKAYISGESQNTIDAPDPVNQLAYQIENLESKSYKATGSKEANNEEQIVSKEECDAYFNSDGWFEKRIGKLFSNSFEPVGVIQNSSTNKVVAVVKAYDCTSVSSNLGYKNITDDILYEDYPFSQIGINSNEELRAGAETIAKKYCILETLRLSGDDIFKSINIDFRNESYTMNSRDNYTDELQCKKYASCLDAETNLYNSGETKSCILTPKGEEEIASFNPADGEYFDFIEREGTLATGLDGTKDMIVLQEYAPGHFGYMSNYRFQLPKNNIIKLNHKEIFPLIPNAPIEDNLIYTFDSKTYKQKTKNREPSSYTPYFETLSFGSSSGGSSASGGFVASFGLGDNALAAIGLGIPIIGLLLLFSGTKSYGTLQTNWDIKRKLANNKFFIPNPYGYDFREYNTANREFTYERTKFGMATLRSGTYSSTLETYLNQKKSSLYFSGYTHDQIDNSLLTDCETDGCVGYPGGFKWYRFSGHHSSSGESKGSNKIMKPVNTIYMGATNTVVVFVPYKGDYEMVALDKNKRVLGRHIVTDSEFIDSGETKHPYAKVMFSISEEFALSPKFANPQNKAPGTITKECLWDDFVEWGGGVSGVYYEQETPGGHNCSKSDDRHVENFSAHYLKFKAVDADKYFEVKLKKPMPFANRFYFVNLGKLENREYECYESKEPCKP